MNRTFLTLTAVVASLLSLTRADAQTLPTTPGLQDNSLGREVTSEISQPDGRALERPSVWGEPTEVRIGMYVIDVDAVDSANQNFSASVYYEARWADPLLAHAGPGPKIVQSTTVWTPRLTIVNQQHNWNAFPSFVEIAPDGEVTYRQKTWGWYSQPLDLRDFPLDQQTLSIHIVAPGLPEKDVKMTPYDPASGRRSGIAERFSLPDFSVVSWNAGPRAYHPFKNESGSAGYIMEIVIERSPHYYFWKLIIPLCLIVAMSWVPRWLKSADTGTKLGVATTAFLTLVAYLFATAVMLPKVTYFTRMDYFILSSTLIVFLGLLQTSLMSALFTEASARTFRRIDLWSRVIYPIILIVVLTLAFTW